MASLWLDGCAIKDVGIDYFTGTALAGKEAVEYLIKADTVLSQERRRGFFLEPWRMSGYEGWKCGRLQMGQRPDGAIVRLSSSLAEGHWWDFWQVSGRCSRIDLQITVDAGPKVTQTILNLRKRVSRHYSKRHDGPTVTVWSNSEGGCTVYLGKRASALYFRCYDKGAESGLKELAGHMRLELEVKNRLTQPTIAQLLRAETVHSGIAGIIGGYLRSRGVSTNLPYMDCRWYKRPPLTTDCLKSLLWLETSVRPTVQRLISFGLIAEVRESLNLPEFVQSDSTNHSATITKETG